MYKVGDKVIVRRRFKRYNPKNGRERSCRWVSLKNQTIGKVYDIIGIGRDGGEIVYQLNTRITYRHCPCNYSYYEDSLTPLVDTNGQYLFDFMNEYETV